MTLSKAYNDSHVSGGGTDANQAAIVSTLRMPSVKLTPVRLSFRMIRKGKHFYTRTDVLALCCLLFVMPSVLALAQSGQAAPTGSVPPIAFDSSSVSGGHVLEIERRSVRGDGTRFAIDKSAPGCEGAPLSTNNALNRVSRQWQAEWTTGHQLAARLEQDAIVVEDPILMAYVNALELAIVRRSDLPGCFLVKILDDSEVNAFSLPGGFLYLTSGLILIAESEGELTAALAHETGHVTARHFARIEHKRRIGRRVALAAGPAGYFVRRVLGPLFTKKLIRNTEFEADRLCLQYQSASGHDPSDFSRLLQVAVRGQGKPHSFVKRLFDTHPLTSTRIKRLDETRDRLPPGITDHPVDSRTFEQAKGRLAVLLNLGIPDSSLPKARP